MKPQMIGPAIFALLAGCQSHQPTSPTVPELVDTAFAQALEQKVESLEAAREKQPGPIQTPGTSGSSNASVSPENLFNIAASDVPARDFFLSLVQELETNIIVHPDVTGAVSINLKNVSLEDILNAVENVYGFSVEKQANTYYIYPPQLSTRIYRLNYLNLKRTGSSAMSVSNGQISNSSSSSGSSSSSSSSGGNSSEILTESEVNFWEGIEQSLRSILGAETGRDVIVNPHTGLVVIKANSSEHKSIEAFLKNTQANLQRQVVIEAKILEVELNHRFESGINWEILGNPGSKTIGLSQASETLVNPDNINGIFSIDLGLNDFKALIQLLETQGDVKVLSSPRISTVNNQKAVIKVGTDEFFVTELAQNTTTTATETTTTPEVTLTPFFSGIALDVTPQISEEGEIILHVHPTVSQVADQTKLIDLGGDQVLSLPLAVSSIRESDSIIKAQSDQVIVIGGLLQSSESKLNANLPWAARLPLIGNLFKQQRLSTQKSELVILLKPMLVQNFTWTQLIKDSQHYLNGQNQPPAKEPSTFK